MAAEKRGAKVCRCDSCSSLWPSLYCMALNYPVHKTDSDEFERKRRGYALFMRSLLALLPCESSRAALARASERGAALHDALNRGREAVCRFVHYAERLWRGEGWGVGFPDRCARYECAARAGGGAGAARRAGGPRGGEPGWFSRGHCSRQGMRSAVWGPPMWLLLYALEASAVEGGRDRAWAAWKDLWSAESMGSVLPCAICRRRYLRETLREIIVPYFEAHAFKAPAKGRLVRSVHEAVRMKVTSSELAPPAWVSLSLRSAADMLSPTR